MFDRKTIAIVALAVTAGVVAGSVATGFASPARRLRAKAPAAVAATTRPFAGSGLKLGAQYRQTGATLADAVAKLTGLTVADVRAQRAAGTSYADIAASKGVSAEKVVAEVLSARSAVLDSLVSAGSLTRAQADQALASMKANLTARVAASDATACGTAGAGCATGAGACGAGANGACGAGGAGACGAGQAAGCGMGNGACGSGACGAAAGQ